MRISSVCLTPLLQIMRVKALTPSQQSLLQLQTSSVPLLLQQTSSPTLIDDPALRTSLHLWRLLLTFERRIHGDLGVHAVFQHIRTRNLAIPVRSAPDLWSALLTSAVRSKPPFLDEVWEYIQAVDAASGRRFRGVYAAVVGHFLHSDSSPARALEWHQKLYPAHTPGSWSAFFRDVITSQPATQRPLREIHACVPGIGVYSAVIPLLCELGMFEEATRWHRHCISFGDLPKRSCDANGLVAWTARYGSVRDLLALVESFTALGVRVVESTLVTIVRSRRDKIEAVRISLARSRGVNRDAMGDRFWSTVLGQTQLDPVVVCRYMESFGGGLVVGWRTVEALMKRLDIDKRTALNFFSEVGMAVHGGLSAIAAEKPSLATARRVQELMAHPTPPTSPIDLEFLLRELLSMRNFRVFEAVLATPVPSPASAAVYNIVLQSRVRAGERRPALDLVDYMRKSFIPISASSLRILIRALLRPRGRGRNPTTAPGRHLPDDLLRVVAVLISLLRSGAPVEPILWREVMKRLGLTRRLQELETLAVTLVEWYHPARSAATRRRFAIFSPTEPQPPPLPPSPAAVVSPAQQQFPADSAFSPLKVLFPKHFFQAIIAWGFLTFRPHPPHSHSRKPLHRHHLPLPHRHRQIPGRYKEFSPCSADPTWGVRLAARLRDAGVDVSAGTVARAVRFGLVATYGRRRCKRRTARMARALRYLRVEEVVAGVDRAWGAGLEELIWGGSVRRGRGGRS